MNIKDEQNAKYLLNKVTNSSKALPSNKDLIFKYYNESLASGQKLASIVNYLKVLSRLTEFVDKPYKEVSREELIIFFNNLKPLPVVLRTPTNTFTYDVKEYSPQTVMRYKTNVKTFFRWLFEGDLDAKRDTDGTPLQVSWIKCNYRKLPCRRPKEVLSREEVGEMIKVSSYPRNKALIAILFETGMRASELLGMKLNEVEFHEDYCEFVCDGKTGKRPVVLIKSYPFLLQWLDELKRSKREVPKEFQHNVWVTINNPHKTSSPVLTTEGLLTMVKTAAEKAGIKKRVWTHGFRHSSATDFAKQGYNETELRLKYGWTETSNIPANYTHYKHNELRNKLLARNGKKTVEPEPDANILKLKECPFCARENPFESEYCSHCGKPLDITRLKAMEQKAQQLNTLQEILKQELEKKGIDMAEITRILTAKTG